MPVITTDQDGKPFEAYFELVLGVEDLDLLIRKEVVLKTPAKTREMAKVDMETAINTLSEQNMIILYTEIRTL